jgi:DNA-binding LytR/AlgR family response regulator
VHRSWWAARGASEGLKRQNGKAQLILREGLTVPVSRAMQATLREQGWG